MKSLALFLVLALSALAALPSAAEAHHRHQHHRHHQIHHARPYSDPGFETWMVVNLMRMRCGCGPEAWQ